VPATENEDLAECRPSADLQEAVGAFGGAVPALRNFKKLLKVLKLVL
jgi:hypothetical protein